MTPAQAKQLSADFAAALERETDEVIRANGMPIVKLLGELSKDMPDDEREQVAKQLPHNLRMFEKAKMNGAVVVPSNCLIERN